jgi:tetrahydromethanopterin S-methyltransferase subunit F
VKIVHRHPAAPAAAVLDVMLPAPEAISMFDARVDASRRRSLITRRQRHARVRSAGRLMGWIAGVVVLLLLVLAAAVGLR